MPYLDIAKSYDEIFIFNPQKIEFLNHYLPKCGLVYDLGCGTGKMTDALNLPNRPVVGIDLDPAMISEAKRLRPKTTFIETSLTSFDFSVTPFVGVHCIGNTLSYLKEQELVAFLTELYNNLPEGGIWIFQTLNWDFVLTQKERYDFPDLEVKNQEVPQQFRRWYDHINEEQLQFHRQTLENGVIQSDEMDILYPQTKEAYQTIHQKVGFTLVGAFSDFRKTTLDSSRDSASIMVFKKWKKRTKQKQVA